MESESPFLLLTAQSCTRLVRILNHTTDCSTPHLHSLLHPDLQLARLLLLGARQPRHHRQNLHEYTIRHKTIKTEAKLR